MSNAYLPFPISPKCFSIKAFSLFYSEQLIETQIGNIIAIINKSFFILKTFLMISNLPQR